MDYKVEYIQKDNYLIRRFTGEIDFPAILKSWQYLVEHDLGDHKHIGVINDFSNVKMNLEMEELEQMINFFKLNSEIFATLKIAVIMSTPKNMVFPMFAKKISTFNIQAFSTMESAEKWMLN